MEATSKPAIGAWKVQAGSFGSEQQPVLIIDNFFADPHALAAEARRAAFDIRAPHYPGVRAAVSPAYLQTAIPALLDLLRLHFGYAAGARVQECFYSRVTQPPETLSPLQCLPHFDGVGDGKVALLHFLCGADEGGTHFFRHRSTGFETVTGDRFQAYKTAIEADVARSGLPKREYVSDSTPLYEKIMTCAAAPNRAILYRGVNLHAIGLGPNHDFNALPGSGRLTVNTFLMPG